MADAQHSSFQHADAHEPRHITLNGTGASGNVITNSSSVTQTSEYRRLKLEDIDEIEEVLLVLETDSTTVQTHFIPGPFNGTIQSWVAVANNALATADNTYELRIDGTIVTSTPITFTFGGSIGDRESAAASGANTFTTGNNIEVVGTTIGNTDAAVDIRFLITVRRG